MYLISKPPTVGSEGSSLEITLFFEPRHPWQILPRDLEDKIAQFRHNIQYTRENGDFPYDLIANMDETPAYFDIVPSKTVDKKDKKSIIVRTTNQ